MLAHTQYTVEKLISLMNIMKSNMTFSLRQYLPIRTYNSYCYIWLDDALNNMLHDMIVFIKTS